MSPNHRNRKRCQLHALHTQRDSRLAHLEDGVRPRIPSRGDRLLTHPGEGSSKTLGTYEAMSGLVVTPL